MTAEPGALLVARPSEDEAGTFARSVVLIVDREPNGIVSGLALNRPSDQTVLATSALALLFVSDPAAPVYWGGPMGRDPAILAQLRATDGLEWFHLPRQQQRRPFPLPDVGLIAVAEHPEPFEERIVQARVYQGLCVWAAGQLERELARGDWMLAPARLDDVFCPEPARLWDVLQARLEP